jgi:hypothetical protein
VGTNVSEELTVFIFRVDVKVRFNLEDGGGTFL